MDLQQDGPVTDTPDAAGAFERYAAALEQMAELPSTAGVAESPRRWNQLVNELQRQQLVLRETSSGRRAISALMDDPRPVVREWAAAHALFWEEARARSVLEAIRDDPDVGAQSINAKYTLIEFDRGRLDPFWEPSPRG